MSWLRIFSTKEPVTSEQIKYDSSEMSVKAKIGSMDTNIANAMNAAQQATNLATEVHGEISNIGRTLFPVGSYFLSANNRNPSSFLGGTWTIEPNTGFNGYVWRRVS